MTNRIDELLRAMTPEEKAGQLTQYFYFNLPSAAEPDPGDAAGAWRSLDNQHQAHSVSRQP